DQKARDARLALRQVRDWLLLDPPSMRVTYRLEPTDAWLEARRVIDAMGEAPRVSPTAEQASIEEQLKLAGMYIAARDGSAARAAAINAARRTGFRPDVAAIAQAAESLRRDFGLHQQHEFEAWRERERIDQREVERFFDNQACFAWARSQMEADGRAHLVEY